MLVNDDRKCEILCYERTQPKPMSDSQFNLFYHFGLRNNRFNEIPTIIVM